MTDPRQIRLDFEGVDWRRADVEAFLGPWEGEPAEATRQDDPGTTIAGADGLVVDRGR